MKLTSKRKARSTDGVRRLPVKSTSTKLRKKPAEPGQDVYERIWGAIMDHSLPPETRLVEERLCEIFGVGRTRLRQVLQRLAHERIITLTPNRGAIVTRPSVKEAREVFAARRVIEAAMIESFLASATKASIKRIHDHVASEKAAWRANDRRSMLTLSGDFHLVIADAAGNSILTELLRDLISRSSLIIAVYRAPGTAACPPDEHQELAAALERRDHDAVDLMLRHLDHVLADLQLVETGAAHIDLRSVFSAARQ
jgi:DNA-binding GntR family transcriptional regulator